MYNQKINLLWKRDIGYGDGTYNKIYAQPVGNQSFIFAVDSEGKLVSLNIKNQKQLDRFLEKYTPALDYDDIAFAVLNYARSDYLTQKILKDPDHFGAVMILLDGIDKIGGAKKAWDEYNNKTKNINIKGNNIEGCIELVPSSLMLEG